MINAFRIPILTLSALVFVGNSKGGKRIWTRGKVVLCCASIEWHILAMFLLGSYRSHLLCLLLTLRHHHCRPFTGDGDLGRHFLPRKVSSWKRGCSCPLPLGICFLLLWWDEIQQEKETKHFPNGIASNYYSNSMIKFFLVFLSVFLLHPICIVKKIINIYIIVNGKMNALDSFGWNFGL